MLTFCRGRLICVMFLLLVGCAAEPLLPTQVPTAVFPASTQRPATATLPPPTPNPTPTLSPTPTNVPERLTVGALAAVPEEVRQLVREFVASSERFQWVEDPQTADLQLTINQGEPLITWIYAIAAPFATVADGVTTDVWQAGWQNGSNEMGTLLMTPETAASWATVWNSGIPRPTLVKPAELTPQLWAERPSLTLLPFHRLSPDLKVLALDGHSPLDPAFDQAAYPLQLSFGLVGNGLEEAQTAVSLFQELWQGPVTNRALAKLSRVALTGVTALVRATAFQMEIQGILYPGTDVKAVLQMADFAHVSNEVAFSPSCPYPNPIGSTTFCSRESYFALLQDIGVDIVELTGNHVNDWGRDDFVYTLDLYAAAGMQTFGGGRNVAEANQPLLLEHNGNKIALTGCNPFGPAYAWATVDQAGSRFCDDGFKAQIQQLRDEGYIVIVTQQYAEYYHYAATAQQQADFRGFVEAGATAVSGSQGHHAQGFDFHNGGFIHYGLGNLFFDQMDRLGTRQTLVDTYTVYDGRLLNVSIWTGIIENYAYPRLASPAEREQTLRTLFQASGW